MGLDRLFSTIILVSFLVTVIMAVGSYAAYKLRESRRPRHAELPSSAPMLVRVTAEAWEQDGANDGAGDAAHDATRDGAGAP